MDWDPDDPGPPGYHLERKIRRNLILRAGALLFTAYVFSAVAAASSTHEAPLWVPVAGPFIQLGQTSSSNSGGLILLGIDGVLQTLEAAFVAYGVASPAHVLVPNSSRPRLSLVPLVTKYGGGGLMIVGTF